MQHWVKSTFPHATNIQTISQEASTRSFFRLKIGQKQYVLMVYPEPAPEEISRILRFSPLYVKAGLHVPFIYENIENQALLQEDLGERYLQYYFNRAVKHEKSILANQAIDMAMRISTIPFTETYLFHDSKRQQFEMDFFLTHFLNPKTRSEEKENLSLRLTLLIRETCQPVSFAHRDFHTRNMLFSKNNHGLVDFQDSLRAHPYYDLASFFWDAYIPWSEPLRSQILASRKGPLNLNIHELETVALQRTIKALGTFAYQVKVRKKTSYARYINRVIKSVINNPQFPRFFPSQLSHLFSFYPE